jgi:hypothetical protein
MRFGEWVGGNLGDQTMTIARVMSAALYLIGAWVALSVLMVQAPWAPADALMQSAKLVLMVVAGLALAVCAFGAGTALLGLSGMYVKAEAAPRPYTPQA